MRLPRLRLTARKWIVAAAWAFLFLAGCDPYFVGSVHGLVGPSERPEPFDPKYVGEWYDPTWKAVQWKVERLIDTDTYFVTHFGDQGKKTFFTASVVKAGDLKLMDLQERPAKGRPAGAHLLIKIQGRLEWRLCFGGPPPGQERKFAALGGGPLVRWKTLTLQLPRKQYFLDHPGLVDTKKTFNKEGKPTGLRLTATPKELREFFEAHGEDEGLWVDEKKGIKLEYQLESKLNPGDL